MAEWELQKAGMRCAVTGQAFAVGETIWSALFEHGEGWVRVDFCEAAWDERQAARQSGQETVPVTCRVTHPDGEREEEIQFTADPVHYWKRVRPAPTDSPKRRYVDDEALFDCFRKLEGAAEDQRQAFRYVLALHLIRRKVLVFMDVVRAGDQEYLILSESSGPRKRGSQPQESSVTYKVLDPHLDEEQILALREQMDRVIEGADDEGDEALAPGDEASSPTSSAAAESSAPA